MSATSNRVELYRVEPNLDEIKIGKPVRGATLEATARLIHWVRGRGRCLVPAHHPRYTIAAASSSTLRYFVPASGVAITRVWLLDVRASAKTASCRFTVQGGAGTTLGPFPVDGRSTNSRPVVYIEPGATQSSTAAEISITVACSFGTARVESVACYEMPRAALERNSTGADLGLAISSFYPREDIWEHDTSNVFALSDTVANTDTRRIGHVSMWHETGFNTSSAVLVDLAPSPQRLVPSQDRVGDTTRLLELYVWGFCSNGTTSGEVTVANGSAAVATPIAIPLLTTAGAWFGPTELAFGCEDLTENDGTPGGTYDTALVKFRRTTGAGSVTMKGYNLVEKVI